MPTATVRSGTPVDKPNGRLLREPEGVEVSVSQPDPQPDWLAGEGTNVCPALPVDVVRDLVAE